jgi:peptidylprolyl isomerase
VKRLAVLLALSALVLSGCAEETSETFEATASAVPVGDPCPSVAQQPEQGNAGVEVSGAADEEPAVTLPGGEQPCTFMFEDVRVGDGPEVTRASTVRAHYIGMSWKANQSFGSSWGSEPLEFSMQRGVISGWLQGLPGMKEGGRRLLIIPPSLGYRHNPRPIVAWDTLVFVVDALEVS